MSKTLSSKRKYNIYEFMSKQCRNADLILATVKEMYDIEKSIDIKINNNNKQRIA